MQKQNRLLNQLTHEHIDRILAKSVEFDSVSAKRYLWNGQALDTHMKIIAKDLIDYQMNKSLAIEKKTLVFNPDIKWSQQNLQSNNIKGISSVSLPFENDKNNVNYLTINIIFCGIPINTTNPNDDLMYLYDRSNYLIFGNQTFLMNKNTSNKNVCDNIFWKRLFKTTEYTTECVISNIYIKDSQSYC